MALWNEDAPRMLRRGTDGRVPETGRDVQQALIAARSRTLAAEPPFQTRLELWCFVVCSGRTVRIDRDSERCDARETDEYS